MTENTHQEDDLIMAITSAMGRQEIGVVAVALVEIIASTICVTTSDAEQRLHLVETAHQAIRERVMQHCGLDGVPFQ